MASLYLAVDGDNVGSHLEYLAITNDTQGLTEFSEKFNLAMNWFERQLVTKFDATIFFCGGDNLLAGINGNGFPIEQIEELRSDFAKKADSSLSIGLGGSPQQAYLALKLAKTGGKNVIRHFKEFTDD